MALLGSPSPLLKRRVSRRTLLLPLPHTVLPVGAVSEEVGVTHRIVGDCPEPPFVLGLAENIALDPFRETQAKKQVQRWIKELDDDAFEVREKATQSLGRLGTSVKAAIEKALKASPSPEMKRRLEELLASITEPPGSEELRQLRALDVLEQIGTREARRLLRTLADGAAHAPLTQAARQALARLERRDKER